MIPNIIAHMHFLEFAILCEFAVKVLVKGVEMLLDLLCVESVSLGVDGILVDVSTEDGLRVVWLYMFSGAVVAVTTGTDFVVEGAVDFVGFSAVYLGELGCH
jgi:hypothetical protein